jgi:hypothetical protein
VRLEQDSVPGHRKVKLAWERDKKATSARGLEPLLTSEIDIKGHCSILVNRLNHSAKPTVVVNRSASAYE